MEFKITIGIRGQNGKVSRQTYDTGDFTTGTDGGDFEAALNAATQVAGAYADVTMGEIAFVSVSHSMPALDSGVVPTNGADVHEYATIAVHLNVSTEVDKTANVKVVAPVDGIFVGSTGVDYDTIDREDADLAQFIQQLAQHTLVSDGEAIITASGVNGMKSGRRNARTYKL